MPIKKENRRKYPKNWKSEIRPSVLNRYDHRCGICDVPNGARGWRNEEGEFQPVWAVEDFAKGHKLIKIVLTIAHLDHNPENNDFDNLMAMCQRCHLTYDAVDNQKKAAETRRRKESGILDRHVEAMDKFILVNKMIAQRAERCDNAKLICADTQEVMTSVPADPSVAPNGEAGYILDPNLSAPLSIDTFPGRAGAVWLCEGDMPIIALSFLDGPPAITISSFDMGVD